MFRVGFFRKNWTTSKDSFEDYGDTRKVRLDKDATVK